MSMRIIAVLHNIMSIYIWFVFQYFRSGCVQRLPINARSRCQMVFGIFVLQIDCCIWLSLCTLLPSDCKLKWKISAWLVYFHNQYFCFRTVLTQHTENLTHPHIQYLPRYFCNEKSRDMCISGDCHAKSFYENLLKWLMTYCIHQKNVFL